MRPRSTFEACSKNRRLVASLAAVLAAGSSMLFLAADWPQFRGPGGTAISADKGLPETWSATENIVWKTKLPGAGASSPITLGDKIFLTCYSGYGQSEDDAGKQEDLRQHVVCANRADGKILWTADIKTVLPETEYRGFQALHGYASSTPATDGEALYVFFGHTGVFVFDLAGKKLWQASVGSKTHDWGSGTSPVLYKDLVILNAGVESGAIVALSKKDGSEVWRTKGIRQSWSTPALAKTAAGKDELVVSSQGKILGLDPATGRELWTCDGIQDYVCPSVVVDKDVAYVMGGRKNAAVAVRVGGSGDVTKTHRLWEAKAGSNVPSMVVSGGYLYWVNDQGLAHCLKADSGEIVYKERISGTDRVYASVVLVDNRLYAVSRERGTFVLAAGPEFKQLAKNEIAGDKSVFNASPAVSNGQLLLRSNQYLYCIGK
ncbi:MAG: outer membrane protein assembly factor BamB family protein [Pirellulales bacterium]